MVDDTIPPTTSAMKRQRYKPGASIDGLLYIPPAKRRAMELAAASSAATAADGGGSGGVTTGSQIQPSPDTRIDHEAKDVNDKSLEYKQQRESWETEKRRIHGTINRLNTATIKPLIHELISTVNIIRLRGVLAKSILQAALSAPKYSTVYAALVAVINTKLPEVGELVVKRTLLSFQRYYRRCDKTACTNTVIFWDIYSIKPWYMK